MHARPRFVLAALLFCSACVSTAEHHASEPAVETDAASQQSAPAELPPETVAAMQLALPGPEHAVIAKLAGDWNCEVRMWMAPSTSPVISTARAQSEMVLGGRFLQTRTHGEMKFGTTAFPFESFGMMGFDRHNGTFTTVGFDTMGTYYVTGAGTQNPETGVITLTGSDHDAASGMTQTYKFVFRLLDDDHYLIELYFTNPEMTHGLDEFKLMEMGCTRV